MVKTHKNNDWEWGGSFLRIYILPVLVIKKFSKPIKNINGWIYDIKKDHELYPLTETLISTYYQII